ncbi:MAG: VWA domain-containing protein [Phycisphaerales bacterium]|nr:VWA domain-containing protein [Phycisphaerales bacterium]
MPIALAVPFLRFETPGYLALLALLPLLIVFSVRSLAGLGPIRRWVAIVVRCIVVTAMVLALAGAQSVRTDDNIAVVFVLDRSNSVPRDQQAAAFDFIRESKEALRPDKDALSIVAVDGVASVEQLFDNTVELAGVSAPIDPDLSNLAGGLRLGAALFPENTSRRIVLLTDGNENVGSVLTEADQLAATGIPVDVVPLKFRHDNEVIFEQLIAPPTAELEETINLQMVVRAQRPVRGKLSIYNNDNLIDSAEVTLDAGPNRLERKVLIDDRHDFRFRAEFVPDDLKNDTIAANNEGRAATMVDSRGGVLIVTSGLEGESSDPNNGREYADARFLGQTLLREKIEGVEVMTAGAAPLDEVINRYSLVILSNVPAHRLTEREQKALSVYVRELGGGLIMVGGDKSYGAGGWLGSEVEKIMPVSFDIKAQRIIPKGALALVMHACEIPQGNYWGERVAVAAIKTLSSRDDVGILSWQWTGAQNGHWIWPLGPVGDKSRVIRAVQKMQMGDMPDLDAVMRPGVEALLKSDARAKHMIVISDFDPSPPGADLLAKMKANNISCSTVGIGYGGHWIDERLAGDIAQKTGGKFYAVKDYSKLPQIFIKESQIVRRSLIDEKDFTPVKRATFSQVLDGIDTMPNLRGLVLTTGKPLAQVPLIRHTKDGDDPVLALWQVGLGKSVAFTSGMWAKWGTHWSSWSEFSTLWGQIVRWAARPGESAQYDIQTIVRGGKARVRVTARDQTAAARTQVAMNGVLVRPNQDVEQLQLTQVGPGQYVSPEFDARDAGSYIFNLSAESREGVQRAHSTLSVAYSPEYRELKANEGLLDELADRTGGRVLEKTDPKAAFARAGLPLAERRQVIWEDLIRLMLLLFLIDVAVRRIAINPLELVRKLRQRIAEVGRPRAAAEASAATLGSLKTVRQQRPPTETGDAPSKGARYDAPQTPGQVSEQLSKALGGATEQDQPVVAKPTRKAAPQSETDYTSRLLRAKRKARDDLKDDGDET